METAKILAYLKALKIRSFQGKPEQVIQNIDSVEKNITEKENNIQIYNTSTPIVQEFKPIERFSRKVFVGGLPPDIDAEQIMFTFSRFGPVTVDWPQKSEPASHFPPKGYAFLLFQKERSVENLIASCMVEDKNFYTSVSSLTIKNKLVQVRPWRISDADCILDPNVPLDPRKTVFVGGVPRTLKAAELAVIIDNLFGGVSYAGIDIDPELKYPKGFGRVAFSNSSSYLAAISARFVLLETADINKRVEIKPFVLDNQICDECNGQNANGNFAPYFCANIKCLQYYCEHCWTVMHSNPERECHKPLIKERTERQKIVSYRFC